MSASLAGSPLLDRREPWLGLTSYGETDSELFFGREKESLELLRLVRREVLTVLFGPSGTGKTSLLNAGLFPRLRISGFFPVAIRLDHSSARPGYIGQIRALIARARQADVGRPIEEQALAPQQAVDRETLWEYLHRTVFWDWRNNPVAPVLVFDQFEEIFTTGRNPAVKEEFLAALADIVENYIPATVRLRLDARGEPLPFPHDRPKAKVILSLREDFVSHLDGLRRAMPSVMHNRFAIARMNGEQALSAVLEPGREIVDAPVAERIVRFVAAANQSRSVAGNPDIPFAGLQVDPALLSVVCRELNARRITEQKDRITEDLLTQAGANILNDFYERGFAGLNAAVRIFVEDRLLTASGFRGTVPMEEATRAGISSQDIGTLIDRRLVRAEERLGIPHLELTHDRLTDVVQKSRDERLEREHRERERLRIESERQERAEREKRRQVELWRTRRLLAIMVAAAVVFLLLGLLAFISYRRAKDANAAANLANKNASEALTTATKQAEAARIQGEEAKKQEGIAKGARTDAELATATERAARAVDLAAQPGREMEALVVALKAMAQTLEKPGTMPTGALIEGLAAAVAAAQRSIPLRTAASFASFSRDGKRTLTSTGVEAKLWDTSDGRLIATFPLALSNFSMADISATSFSCDSREVVTVRNVRDSYGAQVWDARTGAPLRSLTGHTGIVHSAFFSPDSTRVITASADYSVRIWDARTGDTIRELKAGPGQLWGSVSLAVFSSDASRILTIHQDGKDRVWDASTGALIETTGGNALTTSAVFYDDSRRYFIGGRLIATPSPESPCLVRTDRASPDGKLIAVAASARPQLLSAATNLQVKPLKGEFGKESDGHSSQPNYVGFSPNGQFLVSAGGDGTARVWSVRAGEPTDLLRGPPSNVEYAAFAPDNRMVVTVGEIVRLWNTRPDRSIGTLGQQIYDLGSVDSVHSVDSAAFSPDRATAITAHRDGSLRLWSTASGARLTTLRVSGRVFHTGFSRDGSRFIAVTIEPVPNGVTKENVELFDARTRRLIATLEGSVASLGFSLRADRILTFKRSGWLVADVRTGKVLHHKDAYDATFAMLSPDGRFILLQNLLGYSSLVNVQTGNIINLLSHADSGKLAAFSPDSLQVVTPDQQSGVAIAAHDTRTGKVVGTYRGHTGKLTSASFSPDGARLVTASEDHTARIWDVASATSLVTLDHDDGVQYVAFSPDGTQVLTLSRGRVVLWDASSGHRLAKLSGHVGPVNSAEFSRDGRRIVTAGSDGSAKIYSAVVPEILNEYLTVAFRLLRQQPREYEQVRSLEPLLIPYLRALH